MVDTSKTDPDKPREVKVYFTPKELEEIDGFRREFTTFNSRNQLIHMAIDFYMKKTRDSGAVMRKGHPTETSDSTYTIRGELSAIDQARKGKAQKGGHRGRKPGRNRQLAQHAPE